MAKQTNKPEAKKKVVEQPTQEPNYDNLKKKFPNIAEEEFEGDNATVLARLTQLTGATMGDLQRIQNGQ